MNNTKQNKSIHWDRRKQFVISNYFDIPDLFISSFHCIKPTVRDVAFWYKPMDVYEFVAICSLNNFLYSRFRFTRECSTLICSRADRCASRRMSSHSPKPWGNWAIPLTPWGSGISAMRGRTVYRRDAGSIPSLVSGRNETGADPGFLNRGGAKDYVHAARIPSAKPEVPIKGSTQWQNNAFLHPRTHCL